MIDAESLHVSPLLDTPRLGWLSSDPPRVTEGPLIIPQCRRKPLSTTGYQ